MVDLFLVGVTGLQAFEMMGIAAVGNNLITYVFNEMHFPLSKSANIVTNFIGTVFLLSLLGGFLSDSYLGSFLTMLIFGFVELTVSTHNPTTPQNPKKKKEKKQQLFSLYVSLTYMLIAFVACTISIYTI